MKSFRSINTLPASLRVSLLGAPSTGGDPRLMSDNSRDAASATEPALSKNASWLSRENSFLAKIHSWSQEQLGRSCVAVASCSLGEVCQVAVVVVTRNDEGGNSSAACWESWFPTSNPTVAYGERST